MSKGIIMKQFFIDGSYYMYYFLHASVNLLKILRHQKQYFLIVKIYVMIE